MVSVLSGGLRPPFFFTCAHCQVRAPSVHSAASQAARVSQLRKPAMFWAWQRPSARPCVPDTALISLACTVALSLCAHLRCGHRQAVLGACAGLRGAGRAARAQAALHQLLPAQRLLGALAVIPARACTARAVSPPAPRSGLQPVYEAVGRTAGAGSSGSAARAAQARRPAAPRRQIARCCRRWYLVARNPRAPAVSRKVPAIGGDQRPGVPHSCLMWGRRRCAHA